MNSANQPLLSELVSKVREISTAALSRYATASDAGSRETILLKGGILAGFRFTSGQFSVRWLVNEDSLQIFRDLQPLVLIPIDSAQNIKHAA